MSQQNLNENPIKLSVSGVGARGDQAVPPGLGVDIGGNDDNGHAGITDRATYRRRRCRQFLRLPPVDDDQTALARQRCRAGQPETLRRCADDGLPPL